jgi:CyaY protein
MDERQFEALAGEALARIERALDQSAVEADIELKEGGVLELEFDDGSKIIVNRHGAAREIWVAARSGGFHLGTELFAALSKLVSAQAGTGVILS